MLMNLLTSLQDYAQQQHQDDLMEAGPIGVLGDAREVVSFLFVITKENCCCNS